MLVCGPRVYAEEPLQLWGELAASYRVHKIELNDGGTTEGDRRMYQARINTVATLWRPWFALAEGSVSLNQIESDLSEEGEDSTDFFGTGTARLRMFPLSHFPTVAFWEIDDSRMDTDLSDQDFRTIRYGLEQSYRNQSGDSSYYGRYERGDYESNIDAERDDLQLSMTRNWTGQNLQLNANMVRRSDDADNEIEDYFFVGRHSYFDKADLSVETLFSIADNEHEFQSDRRSILTNQITSFLSWRPDIPRPLTITASFRGLTLDTDTRQDDKLVSETDLENLTVTAGANYQYSTSVNMFSTITRGQNSLEGKSQNTASETVGANYQSRGIPLQGYTYSWGAGSSLGRLSNDIEDDTRGTVSLRQGISRGWNFTAQRQLNFTLDQRLSYDHTGKFGSERSLVHTLTLRANPLSNDRNAMLLINASDMRNSGRLEDESQLLNIQFSSSVPINRISSWTGNITLQGMRTKTEFATDQYLIASAQLSYQNSQLFNNRGLHLKTELRAASESLVDRREEDNLNFNARERARWRTDIDYFIGLLQFKFVAEIAEYNSGLNSAVELKIIRRFDAY